MTISSPEGSSSIFTSRKVTPRCFRNDFVRQQSGHQLVLYMVMGSISSGFPNDPNDWMRAAEGGRRQCLVRDKRMLHDPETSALRLLVATWMRISARCSATLARSNRYLGHWMPSVFPRGPAPLWRVASRSLLHARRFPQEWWHGPEGPQQIHE